MQLPPEPPGAADRGGLIALGREALGRALADGGIHAGNLAYLALVTLFPAAILLVSVAGIVGQSEAGRAALSGFFALLPRETAAFLAPLVAEVLATRSGALVPVSILVGLWTVSGFIETLRSIVHKAYRIPIRRPLWQTRLLSALVALAAAVSVLASLLLDLALRYALPVLARLGLATLPGPILETIPLLVAFGALWLLYAGLTPREARARTHWPGAFLVLLIWVVAAAGIGPVLSLSGGMALTYGALSGVMAALLFFWVLGFALVLGAEANAVLSKARVAGLDSAASGQGEQ